MNGGDGRERLTLALVPADAGDFRPWTITAIRVRVVVVSLITYTLSLSLSRFGGSKLNYSWGFPLARPSHRMAWTRSMDHGPSWTPGKFVWTDGDGTK